jgi:hypothetical protein
MPTFAHMFESIRWSQHKIQTNNIRKGIHHNALHKIINSILCGLIRLLKNGNNKIQISEQNLWKDLWDTWSILLMVLSKLGFTMHQQAVLQKIPTIFYRSLSYHISMKSVKQFMGYMEISIYGFIQTSFIVDQYGWKLALPNILWKSPKSISKVSRKLFMAYIKVKVAPVIN